MSKTQHPITDELLDQLLANCQKPEDCIAPTSLDTLQALEIALFILKRR
ncbi:hypothetical protein [Pseudomonas songnenensis]|nr:hypothetical protein [Pseudomonas songnenensis]